MNIRDGHHRKVSFDMKEELGDKIDKLAVMIGKLAKKGSRTISLNDRYTKAEVKAGI